AAGRSAAEQLEGLIQKVGEHGLRGGSEAARRDGEGDRRGHEPGEPIHRSPSGPLRGGTSRRSEIRFIAIGLLGRTSGAVLSPIPPGVTSDLALDFTGAPRYRWRA